MQERENENEREWSYQEQNEEVRMIRTGEREREGKTVGTNGNRPVIHWAFQNDL